MNRFLVILITVALIATIFSIELAHAGPSRVGNGDDGTDLESTVPIKTGILVETRADAVALLKRMNVASIEGLGLLLPEAEKSQLLLVERKGKEQEKGDHVFARTFPEAHAATRFYPSALTLDRKQLVALHVHEALHRSLPAAVREDEKIVSRITLAITDEDTSFDRIKEITGHEIVTAKAATNQTVTSESIGETNSDYRAVIIERPSIFEYGYRSFFRPDANKSVSPVSSLHSLKSFMYPFGDNVVVGVGVELTFVILPERSYLGPVGLSGRAKLATWRKSDVDLFAALHLNTLSDGEIKNTPVGRDTGTIGVSMRRDEKFFRIENQVYFTTGSEVKQTLAGVEYTHKYGASFGAKVLAVGKIPLSISSTLEWGGMAEVLLANPHEVSGGATTEKTGRLRVVSIGPEVGYTTGNMRLTLNGRFIVDSTEGASLDQIGDLMGHGIGQGSVGAAIAWQF